MKTSKRSPESRRSREKRLRKGYNKIAYLKAIEKDYQQLVELHKKTIRRM